MSRRYTSLCAGAAVVLQVQAALHCRTQDPVPLRGVIKDTAELDRPSEYLQEGDRSSSGRVFPKKRLLGDLSTVAGVRTRLGRS